MNINNNNNFKINLINTRKSKHLSKDVFKDYTKSTSRRYIIRSKIPTKNEKLETLNKFLKHIPFLKQSNKKVNSKQNNFKSLIYSKNNKSTIFMDSSGYADRNKKSHRNIKYNYIKNKINCNNKIITGKSIYIDRHIRNNYSSKCTELKNYFDNKFELTVNRKIIPPKRYKRIIFKLKLYLSYIKKFKIICQKEIERIRFPYMPYQSNKAKEFINSAKFGELSEIKKLLNYNKLLIFEFDYIGMNALHWACKRGNYDIVRELINYYPNLDIQDSFGRNCLYYAVQSGDYDICNIILLNKVTPFVLDKNKENFTIFLKNNTKIEYLVSKFTSIHTLLKMVTRESKEEWWNSKVLNK